MPQITPFSRTYTLTFSKFIPNDNCFIIHINLFNVKNGETQIINLGFPKARLLSSFNPEKNIIFSKSGFSDALVKYAYTDEKVELINLEHIIAC